jgi:hypothetical protein
MKWHKFVDAFKRLDNHLSDAVYLHGSYLTGQEKITHSHGRLEAKNQSQEAPRHFRLHIHFADRQTVRRQPIHRTSTPRAYRGGGFF